MNDAVTEERCDVSTPYVLVARESNFQVEDTIRGIRTQDLTVEYNERVRVAASEQGGQGRGSPKEGDRVLGPEGHAIQLISIRF